jgi:hypothetical protein
MSETQTEQSNQIRAVSVDVVVGYLSEIYRQLDAISFNIRSNLNNISQTQGEENNGNSQE